MFNTNKWKKYDPRNIVWGITILVVLLLNVYPFVWMFVGSFIGSEGVTIEHYLKAFSAFNFGEVFLNTLVFSMGITLIGLLLGLFVAIAVSRTNMRCKSLIRSITILGFVSPPWINAMGYIFLLGPRAGIINKAFLNWFGVPLFDIYTMGGMIFVGSLFVYSLVFIIVSKALENMDNSFEEAAMVSGSGTLKTIFTITLPLIKPSILTATVFSLIAGFAMFAVPAILGIPSRTYVFATQLYRLMNAFPPNLHVSAAIAVIFTLLAVLIGVLMIRYQNKIIAGRYAVIGTKGTKKMEFELKHPWLLTACCGIVVLLALVVPYSMVLAMSFMKTGYLDFTLSNLTLDNYRYIFFDYRNMWNAVRNTLFIGVGSALGALIVGSVVSYIQIRTRVFYRNLLSLVVLFTLIVPSSALVVGVIWGWIRPPLALYGTIWLIVICMVARFLPLATRNISDGLQQINVSLEEASSVCGGYWATTFFKITLPLMKPVLLGSFLLGFLSSVRDLLIPIFLGGASARTITLPVAAYIFWGHAEIGPATALSIILVLFTLLIYLPLERIISETV